MDTNVLKQDLNKVRFDLKVTNTDSESGCFDLITFQKEINFNESASRYEFGLPFKEYREILSVSYLKTSHANYIITNI